jgi:hypothetical protein
MYKARRRVRVLDGRREGKRQLGRLKHKYEDDIKMDFIFC